MMLFIEIITLVIVFPLIVFDKLKKPALKVFRAGFLLRMVIMLCAGAFMAFISSGFLEESALKRVAEVI